MQDTPKGVDYEHHRENECIALLLDLLFASLCWQCAANAFLMAHKKRSRSKALDRFAFFKLAADAYY